MELVKLNEIFDIKYGNQLDLNKMVIDLDNGINFVSRSKDNLGVDTKIQKIEKEPFPKGLITVTLGGSYLLSSFVQPFPFYTAQNIKVLSPKKDMTDLQKKFYCYVIESNRFRYTSHGREANKTLDTLLVPSLKSIPCWVNEVKLPSVDTHSRLNKVMILETSKWLEFSLKDLFEIKSSKDPLFGELKEGETPYIASTEYNNGIVKYVDMIPSNKGNVLTVNRGGSVGKTFYQEKDFLATPVDVRLLIPKFKLNKHIGLFLSVLIEREKYRFNYSRKMGTSRLKKLKIKLPINREGKPNWQFMEDYIKTLPYSKSLE